MQSPTRTLGVLSAALALSAGSAMAAELGQPGILSRSGQQAGTQTFHGKVMSLHHYLAKGGSGESGQASSIARPGAITTAESQTQSPTPRTTPETIDQNAPPRTAVTEPPREGELRSQPGSDRFGPTDRTTTDRSSALTQTDPTRLGTAPSSSAWAVQPLVLVVSDSSGQNQSDPNQSGQFRSATPSTLDPSRPGATSTDATRQQDPLTARTTQPGDTQQQQQQQPGQAQRQFADAAGMGEVYLLVFDPQNYSSRLALSQAHGMISGSGLSSPETQGDRLPVRGEDDTSIGQRGGIDQRGWDDKSGMGAGAKVKVTGKVLSRGGLKAIEVASIENDSSMDATRESTPGLNRQSDQNNPSQNRPLDQPPQSQPQTQPQSQPPQTTPNP